MLPHGKAIKKKGGGGEESNEKLKKKKTHILILHKNVLYFSYYFWNQSSVSVDLDAYHSLDLNLVLDEWFFLTYNNSDHFKDGRSNLTPSEIQKNILSNPWRLCASSPKHG